MTVIQQRFEQACKNINITEDVFIANCVNKGPFPEREVKSAVRSFYKNTAPNPKANIMYAISSELKTDTVNLYTGNNQDNIEVIGALWNMVVETVQDVAQENGFDLNAFSGRMQALMEVKSLDIELVAEMAQLNLASKNKLMQADPELSMKEMLRVCQVLECPFDWLVSGSY
ncbi:hypothetical protein REH81_01295 [Vibrio rotiferianus]